MITKTSRSGLSPKVMMLTFSILFCCTISMAQGPCPGSNCVSGDIRITDARLVQGVNGGTTSYTDMPTTCGTATQTFTVGIKVTFDVTSQTRYGFVIIADLQNGGVTKSVAHCTPSTQTFSQGLHEITIWNTTDGQPITWSCGTTIQLNNVYTAWRQAIASTSTPDICGLLDRNNNNQLTGTISAANCKSISPKCFFYGSNNPLTVYAPLSVNFGSSFSCPTGNSFQRGVFTSTTEGGKTPYSFNWSLQDVNGSVTLAGTTTASSVTVNFPNAGNFTVTLNLTDALGTTSSKVQQFTVTGCCVTPTSPSANVVTPTCSAGTGTITITAPSDDTYKFKIDNLGFQTSNVFGAVTVGTHTITIARASLPTCLTSISVTVPAAPGAPSAPTLNITQPTCSATSGTITLTADATLDYKLDDLAFGAYPASGWSVSAGVHTITVQRKADHTCTSFNTANIIAALGAPEQPSLNVTQPTCGATSGTITLTEDATLNYKLDNNETFGAYPVNGWSVSAGVHTITVQRKADNTCTSFSTANVVAALGPPAQPSLNVTQPTCAATSGTITLTEDATLNYKLDNGSFGAYPVNGWSISAGVHTITVERKSDNTCTNFRATTIIGALGAPSAPSLSVTQPTCAAPGGKITLTEDGTLDYKLDNGSFGAYPVNGWSVSAGVHTVTVQRKSDHTCTNASNTTIIAALGSPPGPSVRVTVYPSCSSSTGSLTVEISGGGTYTNTEFQFSNDNGQHWQNSPNFSFAAGAGYSITVRRTADPTCTVTTSCAGEQPAGSVNNVTGAAEELQTQRIVIPENKATVTAFPNPYNDRIRFVVTAPESGRGSLELFNILGQKMKTVFEGQFVQGSQTFEVSIPANQRSTLIYRVTLNGQHATGKLLSR